MSGNKIPHLSMFFLPLAIVSGVILAGCSGGVNGLVKKANKKEAQGQYSDAIELYKQALAKGANKERMNSLIANSYRITNRIPESAPYYEAAINAGTRDDKAVFYYAQALKAQGKYADAQVQFDKYADHGTNEALVKTAEQESKNISQINRILQKETRYTIQPIGGEINTEGPEYSPVLYNGNLYYTASNNQFKYGGTGTGFTDIYVYKFDGTSESSGAKQSLTSSINRNTTHEAGEAISPDGSFIVFARSNDGSKKGAVDTDLFIARKKDGDWGDPEKLDISDPKAWESTPALSPNGKTLYFASNRKGGKGGIDLYKATLDGTGQFKDVQNLGDKVNTAGNEMFPYVAADGTLFFSSDGQPGLGALDIFKLTPTASAPENLGTPMNSSADDFSIFYKDSLNGYFASNRPGGKGDDDIYTFRLKPIPIPRNYQYKLHIAVNTPVFKTKTRKPVDKAHIKFDNTKGDVLAESYTDVSGTTSLVVDSTINYSVVIDREGFFTYKEHFTTKGLSYNLDSISPRDWVKVLKDTMTITMKKIKIGEEILLENIYYDYNSATIRADAEPDLNLMIDFMKENPHVKVQLGSHTDSRGNKKYNLTLSEARAKSAVEYIVSHGIEASRIKAKGYGDTQHIVKDAQTEEDHQKNRRTEFKVIEITK